MAPGSAMSSERLQLASNDLPQLTVRAILEEDIESLRTWKNAYRDRFFFQDVITPEMQQEWFQAYLLREHDFMFVVMHADQRVGCLGFRLLADRIDFYNVIVDSHSARKGYMSHALDLLCDAARKRYPRLPVMVSVLRSNPDMKWYLERGFTVTSEQAAHMELTRSFDGVMPAPSARRSTAKTTDTASTGSSRK